jgi:hypothetical protein
MFGTLILSCKCDHRIHDSLDGGRELSKRLCHPGKKNLQNTFIANKISNAAQGWRVVGAMLCSPYNDINRSYLESVIPKKVRKTVESTGDQPVFKMVPRTDELVRGLMAAGRAWNVKIRIEPEKLVLQYFSNEECVKERTLSYANSKWSVYELSEACA